MIPLWRIDGPFGGVDAIIVFSSVAVMAALIVVTGIVARQVARMQPKAAPAAPALGARAAELDQWTERPKSEADPQAEYYALYGSMPARTEVLSPRGPPPPPRPAPLGEVIVDLGGPPVQEEAWVDVPPAVEPAAPVVTPVSGPPPVRMHPPPVPPKPTGPTGEVIAPSHARRGRDTSTGYFGQADEPAPPLFERASTVPGAVTPRVSSTTTTPARMIPAPPVPAPPPAPPPPPPPEVLAARMKKAQEALPEGTPMQASAKSAFRRPVGPSGAPAVGTGSAGLQEGQETTPGKKAIRCPKCSTVFQGPAERPATVKCPACGTTGRLK